MNNPRRIQRHLVKALAAGALLAAAALPMAIATAAGAADTVSAATFSTINGGGSTTASDYFATGASGNFSLTGAFAGDGGNVTVTSTAPGATFTPDPDTSTTTLTGSFATTSATVPGTYPITVTDNGGTGTLAGAFTVYPDPSVSSLSITSASDTPTPFTSVSGITVSGSGFIASYGPTVALSNSTAAEPTVVFTNTTDGTTLTTASVTGGGTSETTPTTTLTVGVKLENPHTLSAASSGTYDVTVINPDGGSFTSGPLFTVIGNSVTTVTPSAINDTTGVASTDSLSIQGSGFQANPTISFGTAAQCVDVTATNIAVQSAASITFTANVSTGNTGGLTTCPVTVTNSGSGDNLAAFTLPGGLGINEAATAAPVVTASSLSSATAIEAGSAAQPITFTGTGFSQYTSPVGTAYGTSNTNDSHATIGTTPAACLGGLSGTSLTCELTVGAGSVAGAHAAELENTSSTVYFPGAFTVAGPAITSASPTALAVGAPVGTVVTFTGTGFSNTSQGSLTPSGTLLGVFQNVSATSEEFVVTRSPSIADNGDPITINTTDSLGAAQTSLPFTLKVDAAPTVSSISYAAGTSGVGVGATAQTVTINGTALESGATVTAFANGTAVADPNVVATVTGVNAYNTALTATIAIKAGDTNTIDGYKVTNPDGGVVTVSAVAPSGLTIDAAPTITSVTPTSGAAGSTTSFAVAGTGFLSGAVTSLSPANGTCGTTTVSASTTIAATCTLGQPSSAATYLVVTNPDGGSATSTTAVLAAKSVSTAPAFHVGGVHGAAVEGRTVTITISGTGFYGQPKIISNAPARFGVVKDNGRMLVVHVTTRANTRAGEHVLVVRLANGKAGRAGFNVKK